MVCGLAGPPSEIPRSATSGGSSQSRARDAVLAHVRKLHATGGSMAAERKRLEKDEKWLVAAIERLTAVIETGDGLVKSLTARRSDREHELTVARSQRHVLEEQAKVKTKLPSAAQLLEHLEAVKGELLGDVARATVILRQLPVGPIRVVPSLRVDRKKVVPRLAEPYVRLTEKPDKVSKWCSRHSPKPALRLAYSHCLLRPEPTSTTSTAADSGRSRQEASAATGTTRSALHFSAGVHAGAHPALLRRSRAAQW